MRLSACNEQPQAAEPHRHLSHFAFAQFGARHFAQMFVPQTPCVQCPGSSRLPRSESAGLPGCSQGVRSGRRQSGRWPATAPRILASSIYSGGVQTAASVAIKPAEGLALASRVAEYRVPIGCPVIPVPIHAALPGTSRENQAKHPQRFAGGLNPAELLSSVSWLAGHRRLCSNFAKLRHWRSECGVPSWQPLRAHRGVVGGYRLSSLCRQSSNTRPAANRTA